MYILKSLFNLMKSGGEAEEPQAQPDAGAPDNQGQPKPNIQEVPQPNNAPIPEPVQLPPTDGGGEVIVPDIPPPPVEPMIPRPPQQQVEPPQAEDDKQEATPQDRMEQAKERRERREARIEESNRKRNDELDARREERMKPSEGLREMIEQNKKLDAQAEAPMQAEPQPQAKVPAQEPNLEAEPQASTDEGFVASLFKDLGIDTSTLAGIQAQIQALEDSAMSYEEETIEPVLEDLMPIAEPRSVPAWDSFKIFGSDTTGYDQMLSGGHVYLNGEECAGDLATNEWEYFNWSSGTTYGYITVTDPDTETDPDATGTFTVTIDGGGFPDPGDDEQIIPLFEVGTTTADGKIMPDLDDFRIYHTGDVHLGGGVEWPQEEKKQYMVLQLKEDVTGTIKTSHLEFDYVRAVEL